MAATRSNVVGTSNYRGGALREDLAPFISNISPEATPFCSTLGSAKATLPRHEWQVDTLVDPTNSRVNGSFEFDTSNNVDETTDRLSNYTQVNAKTVHIEGSLLRSDPAGASNWFSYTMKKRAKELKRDFEVDALEYQSFTVGQGPIYDAAGTGTGARKMGGFTSFTANWVGAAAQVLEINGTTGTGTTVNNAEGNAYTVAADQGDAINIHAQLSASTTLGYGSHVVQYTTSPTNVQLTEAHISSLMKSFHDNGGMPNVAMVPSGLKTRVSNLLIAGQGGAAERRASEMSKRVNLAVDSVITEFGFDLSIIPNYIMENFANSASAAVYVYDSNMIKEATLQPMTVEEDMTARYGKGAIMFQEKTIEYRNPNSNGAITGVTA